MFSHITLGSDDLERSKAFYDAVLPAVGLHLQSYHPRSGWIIYRREAQPRAEFYVCRPINGMPASAGNGTTVGLLAPDREAVRRFFEAGIAAGGQSEGAPGNREYAENFYGAYIRDPDGHKICCVCYEPG